MGLFKKKPTVDPADFLALRAELQDVKARLDASEQAKAYLEARLGSLDATTSALTSASSARHTEFGEQLTALAARLNLTEGETAKVATLLARVADVEDRQRESAAAVLATGDVVPAEDLTPRLEELAARLEEVAAQAARVEQNTTDALAAASAVTTSNESTAAPAPVLDEALAYRVEQLAARTEAIDHIAQQVESLAQRMNTQVELSHELDLLNARIGELQANAGATDEIRLRVERLAEQAAEATTTTDTSALADQLAQLAERVSMNANETKQAREQAAALDARIASVSTELANQLTELGHEIDALAAREGGVAGGQAEISDEVIDALRTGQNRLASEQARYEIAFREDLAELAEQLRILRGR